ncbi:MAG: hypothetical protein ACP5M4_04875 [Acidobacteriaceae bacterium]
MRSLGLISRAVLVVTLLAALNVFSANAEKWYQPTAQQLKMTTDPKAPNAAAVYLFREETVNDKEHDHTFSAVIKVLTSVLGYWCCRALYGRGLSSQSRRGCEIVSGSCAWKASGLHFQGAS